MSSLTVNLCVRKPKDYLNYHLQSFKVDNIVNFPNQITVEEVRGCSHKERKQYTKVLKSFIGTTMSFMVLTSRSMAQTLQNTPSQQVVTTGLPPDLVEPLFDLIKLALGGSVLLAVLLMIAAGVLRMLRKKKESAEWTQDIIKGFVQIMIATPLIFLMYYVATLLLGNFSHFLNPFSVPSNG